MLSSGEVRGQQQVWSYQEKDGARSECRGTVGGMERGAMKIHHIKGRKREVNLERRHETLGIDAATNGGRGGTRGARDTTLFDVVRPATPLPSLGGALHVSSNLFSLYRFMGQGEVLMASKGS